jgi:hypothetical protein
LNPFAVEFLNFSLNPLVRENPPVINEPFENKGQSPLNPVEQRRIPPVKPKGVGLKGAPLKIRCEVEGEKVAHDSYEYIIDDIDKNSFCECVDYQKDRIKEYVIDDIRYFNNKLGNTKKN